MNINSAFPSTYIAASDLRGNAVVVTIREVKIEQVGRDRESKPVLYFEGKTKGMVLNKTNARNIANIAGSADTEDWAGAQIAIYPTETEFAGETVECIRVKQPKAARCAATREPGQDDSEFDSGPAPVAATAPALPPPPAPARAPLANNWPSTIADDDIPF